MITRSLYKNEVNIKSIYSHYERDQTEGGSSQHPSTNAGNRGGREGGKGYYSARNSKSVGNLKLLLLSRDLLSK